MQKLSLDALARELVSQAAGGEKPGDSRVSRTVVGGHEKALRQTVIALAKDAALAEHASPGEATVLVLRGRVTLAAGAESWEGREGDLIIVPDAPHSLTAQADSAVLLTVVKRPLPARRPLPWRSVRRVPRVTRSAPRGRRSPWPVRPPTPGSTAGSAGRRAAPTRAQRFSRPENDRELAG